MTGAPTELKRIALIDATTPKRAGEIAALLPPGFAFDWGESEQETDIRARLARADYALAGQIGVDERLFAAAPRLKMLHKWGVGVDNFDLAAARARGIRVARATGSNALPVAEFTLGLMLAALRAIALAHQRLQAGQWLSPARLPTPPRLLSGRIIGLVGLGAIGSALARLLKGFGCTLLYCKRQRLAPAEEALLGVQFATLDDLLRQADIVSLHCPLTEETANLFDAAAFARMKRGSYLINVARGGIVVEADLIAALQSKHLAGAAMDVFSIEPLPEGSPLRGIETLVLTSHLAAATGDTFAPTIARIFENFRRHASGEALPEADIVV